MVARVDNDYSPPDPLTDPTLSPGGSDSGVPPGTKTALDLGDERRRPRDELADVFGLDFGETTTRLAGLISGLPVMTQPGIFSSSAYVNDEEQHDESPRLILNLRTKLRQSLSRATVDPDIEEIVKGHFEKIRSDIEYGTGFLTPKVVLTVPAYYCSAEREQLVNCATRAGFRVLGLINDYAAVLHAFVHRRSARRGRMLVVTFGADSTSIAIVSASNTLIETRLAHSFSCHGASYILRRLAATIDPSNYNSATCNPCELSMDWQSLIIEVMHSDAGHLDLPNLDCQTYSTVERAEIAGVIKDALKTTMDAISEMVASLKLLPTELDFILFVGKLFQVDLVRRSLASMFRGCRVMVLNADKAPCFGAVLRGGVLDGQIREPLLWDVLTQPIMVPAPEGERIVVPANVSLPVNTQLAMSKDFDSFNLFQSRFIEDKLAQEPLAVPYTVENQNKFSVKVAIDDSGLVTLSTTFQ